MPWAASLNVAVALIFNPEGKLLITQRPLHVPHGGLWEFPGGKCEGHESPEQALIREIHEEVGLTVLQHTLFHEMTCVYASKEIRLFFFTVKQFQGEPVCLESQLGLRWVCLDDLMNYDFPKANLAIIKRLCTYKKRVPL